MMRLITCLCVCVCVCEREREREHVCVSTLFQWSVSSACVGSFVCSALHIFIIYVMTINTGS